MVVVSGGVFIVPSYLAMVVFKQNVYVGWIIASTYIITLGVAFLLRFLQGKWKAMRVVEEVPPFTSPILPPNPVSEYEI